MVMASSDDELDDTSDIRCIACQKKVPAEQGWWCAAPKCRNRCHKQQQCSGHDESMAQQPWFCRGTCYHNHCAMRTETLATSRKQACNADSLYIATVDAEGDLLHKRYQLWNLLRNENYDVLLVTNAQIHTSLADDTQAAIDSDEGRPPLKASRWRYYEYAHYELWHTRPSATGGLAMYVRKRLQPQKVAVENVGAFDLIVVKRKSESTYVIGVNRRANFTSGQHCFTKLTARVRKHTGMNKKVKKNHQPPPPPTIIMAGNVGCDYWRHRRLFTGLETELGVQQQVLVANADIPMLPGNQLLYATRRHRLDPLEEPVLTQAAAVGDSPRDAFEGHFNQICDQFDCLAPELSKRELSKLSYGQKQAVQLGFKLALAYYGRHGSCPNVLFTSNYGIESTNCGLDSGLNGVDETSPRLVWGMVAVAGGGGSGQVTGRPDSRGEDDSEDTHDTLSKYHHSSTVTTTAAVSMPHHHTTVEYSEVQVDRPRSSHQAQSVPAKTSPLPPTNVMETSHSSSQGVSVRTTEFEVKQHFLHGSSAPPQTSPHPAAYPTSAPPPPPPPPGSAPSPPPPATADTHHHVVDPAHSPIVSRAPDHSRLDSEFNALMSESLQSSEHHHHPDEIDPDDLDEQPEQPDEGEGGQNEYMSLIRSDELLLSTSQGGGSQPGSMIVHGGEPEPEQPTGGGGGKPIAYV